MGKNLRLALLWGRETFSLIRQPEERLGLGFTFPHGPPASQNIRRWRFIVSASKAMQSSRHPRKCEEEASEDLEIMGWVKPRPVFQKIRRYEEVQGSSRILGFFISVLYLC